MAPQERFEALRADTWKRAGSRLADLAYANPWSGPPSAIVEAMRQALAPEERKTLDLQYSPYGGHTIPRRLVAQRLAAITDLPFKFRDVVLTPGAMAALTAVFRLLAARTEHAEPEVIVPTPCWLDYPLYLADAGIKPVLVPMRADTLRLDLEAIERALSPRTLGLVLSQPSNPTGLFHTRADLSGLAALLSAQANPPLLISDECHRDVLFEPSAWLAPATLYPRTVITYSFGKTSFLQGQRIGYAAVSPRLEDGGALANDLVRMCRAAGLCTPTALMQRVIPALLDSVPDLPALAARRDEVVAQLTRADIEVPPAQATFFLYPKVPDGDDWALTERLAARGVLVMPAATFHHRGHIRISLTGTEAMIARGTAELVAVARKT
jgi:aspartate aminotransferase